VQNVEQISNNFCSSNFSFCIFNLIFLVFFFEYSTVEANFINSEWAPLNGILDNVIKLGSFSKSRPLKLASLKGKGRLDNVIIG